MEDRGEDCHLIAFMGACWTAYKVSCSVQCNVVRHFGAIYIVRFYTLTSKHGSHVTRNSVRHDASLLHLCTAPHGYTFQQLSHYRDTFPSFCMGWCQTAWMIFDLRYADHFALIWLCSTWKQKLQERWENELLKKKNELEFESFSSNWSMLFFFRKQLCIWLYIGKGYMQFYGLSIMLQVTFTCISVKYSGSCLDSVTELDLYNFEGNTSACKETKE